MATAHDLPTLETASRALHTALERLDQLRRQFDEAMQIQREIAAQELEVRKCRLAVTEAELDMIEDQDSPAAKEVRHQIVEETSALIAQRTIFAQRYPDHPLAR